MYEFPHYAIIPNLLSTVGLRALRSSVMKHCTFWDINFCVPVKVSRRFGGNVLTPHSVSEKSKQDFILADHFPWLSRKP
jgi:hypothetical protein